MGAIVQSGPNAKFLPHLAHPFPQNQAPDSACFHLLQLLHQEQGQVEFAEEPPAISVKCVTSSGKLVCLEVESQAN